LSSPGATGRAAGFATPILFALPGRQLLFDGLERKTPFLFARTLLVNLRLCSLQRRVSLFSA
jgi:hypothetical protein